MEVSGLKANCMMGFAHERVPSTGLGTKELKTVNERSLSSSSGLPPPSSTGQRLEKARGGTHRIVEGWIGLGQDKGGGLWHLILPTPCKKCTPTHTHRSTQPLHTYRPVCGSTSLAHGQLQLRGHHPNPRHLKTRFPVSS